MFKRYEAPPDRFKLADLPATLEDACSASNESVRAKARASMIQFYYLLGSRFTDAQHKSDSSEDEEASRIEAVRICLTLFRLRWQQFAKGRHKILEDIEKEAGQITVGVRLKNLVDSIAMSVFSADDPEKALGEILRGRPRRGPKRKYDYRDLMIAADVEELRRKDETLDAAYDAIRVRLAKEKAEIGPDAIRKIYARIMEDERACMAVKAELAWRQLQNR
jgi:hypothetical protein